MTQKQAIQLLEEKRVRTAWDTKREKWWFSIVDVTSVLIDSDYQTARKYWKVLKGRLIKEGFESVTNCYQLKMQSTDGKHYLTDVADTEQLFRIIQSIPSPKAEPFKRWMAQVAAQRIDQMQDPELSIDQAVADYRRLSYSEAWINQRMRSIEVRKHLTDEWKRAGLEEGQQFASLTDIIYRQWSGLSAKEYTFKGWRRMKKCVILPANTKHKMMNTTTDTEEKIDFEAIEDDLTPEQRAYWEASIERDLRDIAEGKPRKYISGDEFWGKVTEALMRHYEKV